MATETTQIRSLKDLEEQSKKAAKELSEATGSKAIWDKAYQNLKPSLTDLDNVQKGAAEAAKKANKLVESLANKYNDDRARQAREQRKKVDDHIKALEKKVTEAEHARNDAKEKAAAAKTALDESNARIEAAQSDLKALPTVIQAKRKAVEALQSEVSDADVKKKWLEAVVKLEDLVESTKELTALASPEHATALWSKMDGMDEESQMLADELAEAQAAVPVKEQALKTAQTNLDAARKARLDDIEKGLPAESAPAAAPATGAAAAQGPAPESRPASKSRPAPEPGPES
jgi:hypothetical protein